MIRWVNADLPLNIVYSILDVLWSLQPYQLSYK